MNKGNVLAIGNLDSGKTTLINAVLGDDVNVSYWDKMGTPGELAIYDSETVPFRIIETVGFEPSLLKEQKTINSIKKWIKKSKKNDSIENDISVIWFVIDATESKLIPERIKELVKVTSHWKSVPVVVVLTKSYSEFDREANVESAYIAYAKQKKYFENLRKILPVVASTYMLNENAFAPPEGIEELIDLTNELMPEGLQIAENNLSKFKLNQKRVLTHGMTVAATTAAVAVAATPIPLPDAHILVPIEVKLINSIAKTYGIEKNDDSNPFFQTFVEMGTVGIAAKAAINGMKLIPGINIGATLVNAIVAGVIVASLGEGAIFIFEQIHLGKKTTADINWLNEFMESKQIPQIVNMIEEITKKIDSKTEAKDIPRIIFEVLGKTFKSRKKLEETSV